MERELVEFQQQAAQQVVDLAEKLQHCNMQISCAESCTGGLLASLCTDLAGSSQWFERGFVTYSNLAKQQMLGVEAETLQLFGAVSEQTAAAMVRGAKARSQADLSVSITGIAGPTGGSVEKPVGTVCFGFIDAANQISTVTRQFAGDRSQVRWQSALFALQQLYRLLD